MIDRFQIEDLIHQDTSGVVFRAIDRESGEPVAVRRFFPFGADGGGLAADEQTAYNIAVARLAGLRHPAFRSVVTGGCDPVDGMPFIATEWIDGGPVSLALRRGPLPPGVAAELLTQALEVCELLSQVLAEEAVWVETDPETIILGSESSGRGFTFWISPLKWLGGVGQSRGLESIVTLTEQLMGWQGRAVGDHAGAGMGAWLKWLRGTAATTTLREARENLAAALGNEPPTHARELLSAARQAQQEPPPRSSKTFVFLMLGLALVLIGAAGWLWTWQSDRQLRESEEVADMLADIERQARADQNPRVEEINRQAERLRKEAAEAWQGGVFRADQGELLARHEGSVASLEGVVRSIGSSQSGRTLYIQFSESPSRDEPRGAVALGAAAEGLDKAALDALVGSKVRITGQVRVQRIAGLQRPEIQIADRRAILLVE